MYIYEIRPNLLKILEKLAKKNKELYERVIKKIKEVINSYDVEHYKNLGYDMKDSKRVQIGSFVLVFRFDKKNKSVIFDDFDHHDRIYKR